MAPYYRLISSGPNPTLPLDKALLQRLEEANAKQLAEIDARLVEAEKTEGETEIADALKAKASYLTRIGDKVRFVSYHHLRFS